ncbi:MAG: polysaccharide biosynthesis/export family protein [Planctomycetes bacterium]|nr:polysaccharide biosynthesis/export family protein [Planctomycetota bacterium]
MRGVALGWVVLCLAGCRLALTRSPKEIFDVLDTLNIDPADRAAYQEELKSRSMRVRMYTAAAWNEIEEMLRRQHEAEGRPLRPLFRMGPNTILNISVESWAAINGAVRVGPDGKIDLPRIGEMWVEGMSIPEFKDEMRRRLSSYLRDPVITVNVSGSEGVLTTRDVRSGRIVVFGSFSQIASAGGIQAVVYDYTGIEDLQQVIAESGGFSGNTQWNRLAVYRKAEDGTVNVILCNWERYLKEADLDQNIRLQGGDVVFFPSHHLYFGMQTKHDIGAIIGFLNDSISLDALVKYWELNDDRIF